VVRSNVWPHHGEQDGHLKEVTQHRRQTNQRHNANASTTIAKSKFGQIHHTEGDSMQNVHSWQIQAMVVLTDEAVMEEGTVMAEEAIDSVIEELL
jgi:hypothetical protein